MRVAVGPWWLAEEAFPKVHRTLSCNKSIKDFDVCRVRYRITIQQPSFGTAWKLSRDKCNWIFRGILLDDISRDIASYKCFHSEASITLSVPITETPSPLKLEIAGAHWLVLSLSAWIPQLVGVKGHRDG